MHGLASFAMRGRSQAAMVATALAMLALIVPLLSILSSAVVALVTLRKGLNDGLVVGGISAVASGLLAFLLFDSPAPAVGFLLVLWLPVWVLSALLRASRSLSTVVQLALGFGLVLVAVIYLQLGDPRELWVPILQSVAKGFVDSGVLGEDHSQSFVELMAAWMTGIFAAGFYIQLVLAMLLARSWQARLYNPGGFREEFHALRTGRVLGVAAVVLLGITLHYGPDAPGLTRDLGLLLAPLFFLQGLAVAHGVVARTAMNIGWLVALYALLFIAIPHAEILVTLVGLADVFADFRGRLKPQAPPEQ